MSRVKRTAAPVCVDGYVRVSRVGKRRGPSFISPTVQREAIDDWTARQGFRLLEVFEELDESGARADRPLLKEAIRRVEVGASSALVVWRVCASSSAWPSISSTASVPDGMPPASERSADIDLTA
jgi:hypothetical protein